MQPVAVYIVTNKRNSTLYVGVTSNLVQRIYQHKAGIITGFTKKYGCNILVYYEIHHDMISAIEREKPIKDESSRKKLKLIADMNREW